jgi:hypothetical protein
MRYQFLPESAVHKQWFSKALQLPFIQSEDSEVVLTGVYRPGEEKGSFPTFYPYAFTNDRIFFQYPDDSGKIKALFYVRGEAVVIDNYHGQHHEVFIAGGVTLQQIMVKFPQYKHERLRLVLNWECMKTSTKKENLMEYLALVPVETAAPKHPNQLLIGPRQTFFQNLVVEFHHWAESMVKEHLDLNPASAPLGWLNFGIHKYGQIDSRILHYWMHFAKQARGHVFFAEPIAGGNEEYASSAQFVAMNYNNLLVSLSKHQEKEIRKTVRQNKLGFDYDTAIEKLIEYTGDRIWRLGDSVSDIGDVSLARDFQTVRINAGIGSGKTRWLQESAGQVEPSFAGLFSRWLVIVPNPTAQLSFLQAVSKRGGLSHRVHCYHFLTASHWGQHENSEFVKQGVAKESRYIVIDGATEFFHLVPKDRFYALFPADPERRFILLG